MKLTGSATRIPFFWRLWRRSNLPAKIVTNWIFRHQVRIHIIKSLKKTILPHTKIHTIEKRIGEIVIKSMGRRGQMIATVFSLHNISLPENHTSQLSLLISQPHVEAASLPHFGRQFSVQPQLSLSQHLQRIFKMQINNLSYST